MSNEAVIVPVPVSPSYALRSAYEAAILAAGLTFVEQSGFLRVEAAKGRRMYVAATKTVRRVDLSGWESPTLAVPHRLGTFGAVTQMLPIAGTPEEQVARFVEALEVMKSLAPREVTKAGAAKAPKAKKAVEVPQVPEDRMALIRKVAAEKNVAVSPNA